MELKNKTEQEIKVIFKPGKAFYYHLTKYRVVNYIFDGDTELIMVKSWNKYHNRWCYDLWEYSEIFYEEKVRFGYVSLTKPKIRKS